VKTIESSALIVRSLTYGEADIIATLLTETHGKLSAVLRGGRKSKKRAPGGLEPFHTTEVRLEDRGGELLTLRNSRVVRVRAGILGSLEALDAAGVLMRWLRHLCPLRHPEPAAWATATALLDALDERPKDPRARLAKAALRLLSDVGYGLELEQCVSCGRPCPENRPACIDPPRGGLVCQRCGGAPTVLSPEVRRVAVAAQRGQDPPLADEQTEAILALVDAVMSVHGDFERG
jgi:DNA repair protein RecO (recombination protein O)